MNVRAGILLIALPGILAAQAVVETAIGAGRAATTAAPMQKAGKAIAGAFDGLNRTLKGAENSTTSLPTATTRVRLTPGTSEIKPADSFEDPSGIQKGMDFTTEVVRRFGPPSLRLTTGPGEETLGYASHGVSVNVTLAGGKVATVQKTGRDVSKGLTIR